MSAIMESPHIRKFESSHERPIELRLIDFKLKAEQRRADWGYGVWLQIAGYCVMIGFVALSFAASMFVLSLIR